MPISDISLTAGMRQNLISLQGTVGLLSRTQSRLATGRKVNSALDNPTAFFAAQALDSRAGDIDALKSDMGQAVQTIQAADKGIKGITSLIEQARGIAQQAESAGTSGSNDAANSTVTLTMNGVADNDTITIAGQVITAKTTLSGSPAYIDVAFVLEPNDLSATTINGHWYTSHLFPVTPGSFDFYTAGSVTQAAINLANEINLDEGGAIIASNPVPGHVRITSGSITVDATTWDLTAGGFNNYATSSFTPATTADDEFVRTGNDVTDAANLASYFNTTTNAGIAALRTAGWSLSASNGVVTVSQTGQDVTTADTTPSNPATIVEADVPGASQTSSSSYDTGTISLAGVAASATVTINGEVFTATASGSPGTAEFYMGGNNVMDAEALAIAINANTTVTGDGFSASADNGVVTITNSAADVAAGDVTTSDGTTLAETVVAADTDLSALQDQYNEIRSQIDTMALDSGYKGKNLLNADTLTVKFEGDHTLDVVGFTASSTSLGITAASWTVPSNASADVDRLITALSTLRSESSAMSSNLSIITTRQSFSTDMVNVLTEGSGKLTLADTNEEGANMLMLQTRQSLSTTALSLASQAAQSVLRLFG